MDDLLRCAESRRRAIVAAFHYEHFRLVPSTNTGTHADGVELSKVVSLLRCLAQSVTAKLSFTPLKTGTFLFKLHHCQTLLLMTSEEFFEKELVNLCFPQIESDQP